jgi:hypothetical protein
MAVDPDRALRTSPSASGGQLRRDWSIDSGATGWLIRGVLRTVPGRPRPVESHASVSKGDVGIVPDDEMIKELDVQQSTGRQGLSREVEVIR